jgi:hypothetical protein
MHARKIAFSLTVALAAASGNAMAASYDLGDVNLALAAGAKGVPMGAFADTLEFSLSTKSYVGVVIKDQPNFSANSFAAVLDIYNLAASLYDGANQWIADLDYSTPGMIGPLTIDQFNLDTMLDVGDYSLKLSGIGWGQAGGLYSYAVAAQPVPEPENWAMMLVGLGLVGYALRRRNVAASKLNA